MPSLTLKRESYTQLWNCIFIIIDSLKDPPGDPLGPAGPGGPGGPAKNVPA